MDPSDYFRTLLGVVSEESGFHFPDRELQAVLDPVDGSTNASHGLPWFATSIAVMDEAGIRVAMVANQATYECFQAVRGAGTTLNGRPIAPTPCESLSQAVVGMSGWPRRHLGWGQFRAYGAVALDLCAVACGRFDGYFDAGSAGHAPWDYLGGLLICQEAGVPVVDLNGRNLATAGLHDRRVLVAAATPTLMGDLLTARRSMIDPDPGR